jgi:exonuclease III
VQGLSANATSGDMLKRQQRVLSNILCLARSADCLLIQETKAQKLSPIFERLKDHFTVLHNSHPTSRHQAGTAILMSIRYAQHFDIKEEIIVPRSCEDFRYSQDRRIYDLIYQDKE